MKGLLIKDLKLIKKQNRILAITALLCAWFFITDRDASAISAYIAAMISIIAVGTIMMNLIMEWDFCLRFQSAAGVMCWRNMYLVFC